MGLSSLAIVMNLIGEQHDINAKLNVLYGQKRNLMQQSQYYQSMMSKAASLASNSPTSVTAIRLPQLSPTGEMQFDDNSNLRMSGITDYQNVIVADPANPDQYLVIPLRNMETGEYNVETEPDPDRPGQRRPVSAGDVHDHRELMPDPANPGRQIEMSRVQTINAATGNFERMPSSHIDEMRRYLPAGRVPLCTVRPGLDVTRLSRQGLYQNANGRVQLPYFTPRRSATSGSDERLGPGEVFLNKEQIQQKCEAYLKSITNREKELDMDIEQLKARLKTVDGQREEFTKYLGEHIKTAFRNPYAQ